MQVAAEYTQGQVAAMAIEYARKIARGIPGTEPTMDHLWRQIADAVTVSTGSARPAVTPRGGRTTYPRAMSAWLAWARAEIATEVSR